LRIRRFESSLVYCFGEAAGLALLSSRPCLPLLPRPWPTCVSDCHFVADLKLTGDFGVRVTIDFPTILPLLNCNHRVGHLKDRPGHLVSLRARGKSCAAQRQTRCANKLSGNFIFMCRLDSFRSLLFKRFYGIRLGSALPARLGAAPRVDCSAPSRTGLFPRQSRSNLIPIRRVSGQMTRRVRVVSPHAARRSSAIASRGSRLLAQ
jgi:hypothetical protein